MAIFTDGTRHLLSHALVAYLTLPIGMTVGWLTVGVPLGWAILIGLPIYSIICLLPPVGLLSLGVGSLWALVSRALIRHPYANPIGSLVMLSLFVVAGAIVATHCGFVLSPW